MLIFCEKAWLGGILITITTILFVLTFGLTVQKMGLTICFSYSKEGLWSCDMFEYRRNIPVLNLFEYMLFRSISLSYNQTNHVEGHILWTQLSFFCQHYSVINHNIYLLYSLVFETQQISFLLFNSWCWWIKVNLCWGSIFNIFFLNFRWEDHSLSYL